MTMETQDALNEDNIKKPQSIKQLLDGLKPVTDTAAVMDLAREYIAGLRKETTVEVEQVMGVFLRTFSLMSKTMRGEQLIPAEIESLFMSETI